MNICSCTASLTKRSPLLQGNVYLYECMAVNMSFIFYGQHFFVIHIHKNIYNCGISIGPYLG